jgi:uncharacterized membrane protein YgcG
MRPRNLTIFALPLVALAIAGCGGGGSDSTTTAATTAATTTALTKEELIARGDSICAEVNAAVGTVGQSSEEGSQVSQVADLYIGMVESLKDIGTPDDTSGYSEFINAGEELSQAEGEAKLADERGDSAALGTAETSATSAYASFGAASEAYGFKECGQEPTAPTPTSAGTTESSPEPETGAPVEPEEEVEEAAPEEVEAAPETGGGAGSGGGGEAPTGEGSGGGSSGGIGPG